MRVSFPFASREALTGLPGKATPDGWVFEGEPMAAQMEPIGAGFELVRYPGCRAGRGIEPGVPVGYSEEDFRDRRDPYMDALARPGHPVADQAP